MQNPAWLAKTQAELGRKEFAQKIHSRKEFWLKEIAYPKKMEPFSYLPHKTGSKSVSESS